MWWLHQQGPPCSVCPTCSALEFAGWPLDFHSTKACLLAYRDATSNLDLSHEPRQVFRVSTTRPAWSACALRSCQGILWCRCPRTTSRGLARPAPTHLMAAVFIDSEPYWPEGWSPAVSCCSARDRCSLGTVRLRQTIRSARCIGISSIDGRIRTVVTEPVRLLVSWRKSSLVYHAEMFFALSVG